MSTKLTRELINYSVSWDNSEFPGHSPACNLDHSDCEDDPLTEKDQSQVKDHTDDSDNNGWNEEKG